MKVEIHSTGDDSILNVRRSIIYNCLNSITSLSSTIEPRRIMPMVDSVLNVARDL